MAVSQNGYSANDRTVIASYTVPGTALKIALRKGDVSVVLLDFLRRYNAEIEPLTHNPQDLWGYAERTIRGSSTTLSNHSSGTAADMRAMAHPLGVVGTFNAVQMARLRALVDSYNGVLRWGGDYGTPARGGRAGSRVDEMHVEINAGPAAVKAVADRIRSGALPASTTPSGDWFDMATKDDLKAAIREELGGVIFQTTGTLPNRRGPGGTNLPSTGGDTLWGYAMSADGAAYRIEGVVNSLRTAIQQNAIGTSTTTNTFTPAKTLADFTTAELLSELSRRTEGK